MDDPVLQALEEKLSEKFPFGIPRKKIGVATGGILHPRSLANLDCLGKGIEGRFKIGRSTVYPVDCVLAFIRSKMTVLEAEVR